MHAPKNRNSRGTLLEPFAVGLWSWANIHILVGCISPICLIGSRKLRCFFRSFCYEMFCTDILWTFEENENRVVACTTSNFSGFFSMVKCGNHRESNSIVAVGSRHRFFVGHKMYVCIYIYGVYIYIYMYIYIYILYIWYIIRHFNVSLLNQHFMIESLWYENFETTKIPMIHS